VLVLAVQVHVGCRNCRVEEGYGWEGIVDSRVQTVFGGFSAEMRPAVRGSSTILHGGSFFLSGICKWAAKMTIPPLDKYVGIGMY
jgi:hypothetical protein